MSIQAGIWNFDGRPVEPSRLAKIGQDLAHAGPDGESSYSEREIAILYRPFHTTTQSRLERQPYVSAMGSVFTWDGRLDNRADLISKLGGALGPETTDVAIVAAAFERWGTNCLVNIVGDWALVVWKPCDKELLLAVDYMSIRRLYYRLTDTEVVWCSRLAPLVLHAEAPMDLDDEYVAGYLAHYGVLGHTPYAQIKAVAPAHFVRVRPQRTTCHQYWTFHPESRIRYKTDRDYEDHFRQIFRQSVRRRLRSDSPILAELSGGLDSSSIVCIADDILAKEGAEAPRLDTVSFYDLSEPAGDDLHYLKKVEEKRGKVGHHFDVCSYQNSLLAPRTSFAAMPGSLAGDKKCAQEYEQMRQNGNLKVTLSGIGGDEMLGGVPDPRSQLADLLLHLRLLEFARQTMAWCLIKRKPWIHLALMALRELAPPSLRARVVKEAKVPEWVDAEFAERYGLSLRQLGPKQNFGYWMPSRKQSARTVVILSEQMACSVERDSYADERRYPFLDRCLIEFLLAVPAEQILRPGQRRSLMRRALAGILPDEVTQRRTKAVVVRRPMIAIENDWNPLEGIVGSSLAAQFGYVNKDRVHEALRAAKNGKAPQLVRLMRTLSLELWLRDVTQRNLIGVSRISSEPRRLPLRSDANSTSSAIAG